MKYIIQRMDCTIHSVDYTIHRMNRNSERVFLSSLCVVAVGTITGFLAEVLDSLSFSPPPVLIASECGHWEVVVGKEDEE